MTMIVGVLGSVTPPGRLLKAVEWAVQAAREADTSVEARVLNLADHRVSFADGRPLDQFGDDTAAVVQTVVDADAVIFASPVYRATFTGALKNLLDLVPVEGLMGKPCGIIAMGATEHHYLGVDWHLRAVLAWFGALTAPSSVYLSSSNFTDGALGDRPRDELRALAATVVRLSASMAGAGASLGPPPLAARRG